MATEEIALKITTDASQTEKSVKSIRQELREAQQSAVSLGRQFGELSPEALAAAKKVANLKDEVGDLKQRIDALNPDAKFKAFTSSLQGVAGGFAGLQGAIGLFGTESAELEKQLLKVQSALALSQGLDSLLEARDSFKTLATIVRTNVVSAFSTLKGAIIATGIGALVVGVGLLIANFETVKKVVLNFIPGLAKVGEFVGKLVEKITDFAGITNEASRAYDRLKKSTEGSNSEIDRQIKLLQAQGGQEKKIAELQKKKIDNQIALTKANKDATTEEKNNLKDLANDKAVIDAQEKKRLAEVSKQATEKQNADRQKRKEEAKKLDEERTQKLLDDIKKQSDQAAYEKQVEADTIADLTAQDEAALQAENDRLATDGKIKVSIAKATSDELINNQKAEAEAKQAINDAYLNTLGQFGNLVSAIAGKNKTLAIAGIVIEQAAAIGRIVSNTAVANAKAVAASPLTGGMPFVAINKVSAALGIASSIAAGAKAISQIKSAPGGSPSGGGSLPSGGGNIPGEPRPTQAPIAPSVQVTQASLMQGGNNVNVQNQSAVKAFVVERDITDSQDRVSKIKAAATL